jgi:DNA-binding transcriptional ArsR family regulator
MFRGVPVTDKVIPVLCKGLKRALSSRRTPPPRCAKTILLSVVTITRKLPVWLATGEEYEKKMWTFITNHGAVLVLIALHGKITAREIAIQLDITERSVRSIIKDLVTEGYVEKRREGRVNVYDIVQDKPIRTNLPRDIAVGDLLKALDG